MLRSLDDLQLYAGEVLTEGALTLNAFADKAKDIRSSVRASLLADYIKRPGCMDQVRQMHRSVGIVVIL